jgi:hypothetical protein
MFLFNEKTLCLCEAETDVILILPKAFQTLISSKFKSIPPNSRPVPLVFFLGTGTERDCSLVESDRSATSAPRWPTGLQYYKYMDILTSTLRLNMHVCICPLIKKLCRTTSYSAASRFLSKDLKQNV